MKRRSSRAGFTLTETLIAVVILALMSAAGAAASGAVLSTRNDMMEVADAQVLASTVLETLADEIRFGQDVRVQDSTGELRLNSLSFGADAVFTVGDDGRVKAVSDALKGKGGEFALLLPDSAYTTLRVKTLSFEKETDSGGVPTGAVVIKLTIEGRGGELWSGSLTVTPLNGIRE